MSSNTDSENHKIMKKLQRKLNGELGDVWWNLYIAGAFWSNISTPINLSITLLSAITAGQATTTNMLSQSLFIKISIASLIISTLNTFFRPHGQLMSIMDSLKKINELGFKFESIYYTECDDEDDYKRRYKEYKNILLELNKFQQSQSPDQQNFFTDFIYWLFKNYSCLNKSYKWLDLDMSYIEEQEYNKSHQPAVCCEPCSTCCMNTDGQVINSTSNFYKETESLNQTQAKTNLELKIDSSQPSKLSKIIISDEENQLPVDEKI